MRYCHLPLAGAMALALNLIPNLFSQPASAQSSESKSVTAPAEDAKPAQPGTDASDKPNAAGTVTTTTTTVPSSSNNYLDDGLRWNYFVTAKTDPGKPADVCLPPGTRLLGIKSTFDTVTQTIPVAGATETPTSVQQYLETVLDPRSEVFSLLGGPQKAITTPTKKCVTVQTSKTIKPGQVIYISSTDLGMATYRSGFDYGALVVPFKVQLTGAQSFTGSTAIGGYLGYRLPWASMGISVSPIIFAGASNISTSVTTGGVTTSQTVAGLTYGFGMIARIKNSFQVGLILGYDHVDSAQPYTYNDKPWLSFEIGYSFAD